MWWLRDKNNTNHPFADVASIWVATNPHPRFSLSPTIAFEDNVAIRVLFQERVFRIPKIPRESISAFTMCDNMAVVVTSDGRFLVIGKRDGNVGAQSKYRAYHCLTVV